MSGRASLVLSCEHAGNEVPPAYAALFDSGEGRAALAGHRGWDPGSLECGEVMARTLEAPLLVQPVTRLLVECNRSLDHPRLFSEFSRRLDASARDELIRRYWRPHRERVRCEVTAARGALVVHVGVHTFIPVWDGRPRETDVGFLYDPAREREAALVRKWRTELGRRDVDAGPGGGGLRIHLNRPYRGWTDGLTTALRRELPEGRYLGIELEVSQGLAGKASELGRVMAEALRAALGDI